MKHIFLTLTLLIASLSAVAQELSTQFSYESFKLGSVTLPYRVAELCHEGTTLAALVLYLHGGTSRGNDNEMQLKEKAVSVIYEYLSSHGIAATLIVPQCPTGGGWTSQNRKVINDLLKSYINTGKGDANRIYVMGGSMGGTGTWCQLSYFPDFYAAAMPVAGNPTDMNAVNVATTPVLTVMGTADNMMSIPAVEDFRTLVIAAGGSVQLDIEEGWSHPATCEQSYTEERLNWLFSQMRGEPSAIATIPMQHSSPGAMYDLSGKRVTTIPKGIYMVDGKKIMK